MFFTRVSESIKTAFAFSLVWDHNACVSHASLHLLRRFLRFSSYRVTMYAFHTRLHRLKKLLRFFVSCYTMHAFHTRVCIGQDGFCVFLGVLSRYMRFTRLSVCMATAFVFSFVSRYNACISNACLHRLTRLLRFPWYGVTIYSIHTRVYID